MGARRTCTIDEERSRIVAVPVLGTDPLTDLERATYLRRRRRRPIPRSVRNALGFQGTTAPKTVTEFRQIPPPPPPPELPWWRDKEWLTSLGTLLGGVGAIGLLVLEIADRL